MTTIDYDHAPLPELLKSVRDHLGLTQEQLAEALGSHRVTVANWERGSRTCDLPGAVRLALEMLVQRARKKRKSAA